MIPYFTNLEDGLLCRIWCSTRHWALVLDEMFLASSTKGSLLFFLGSVLFVGLYYTAAARNSTVNPRLERMTPSHQYSYVQTYTDTITFTYISASHSILLTIRTPAVAQNEYTRCAVGDYRAHVGSDTRLLYVAPHRLQMGVTSIPEARNSFLGCNSMPIGFGSFWCLGCWYRQAFNPPNYENRVCLVTAGPRRSVC